MKFDYTKNEAIKTVIESFKETEDIEMCMRFKREIEEDYGKQFDSWESAVAYEIADRFGIIREMVTSDDPFGTLDRAIANGQL